MPRGRPRTGRERYVSVKLRQETHESWIKAKRYFQMNSDDALAKHLLQVATSSTPVTSNVSGLSNFREATNDSIYLNTAMRSQNAVPDRTQR